MTSITERITLYTGTIPNKATQTPAVFNGAADTTMDWLLNAPTEYNTFAAEANILAEECNDAALTAIAGSNFRGLWTALTGAVAVGDSVWYLNKYWVCVSARLDITLHMPGTSSIWKEWVLPLDSVNVLATFLLSSAATVNITDIITSVYSSYEIELQNVVPATDAVSFIVRTSSDNGATWDAGASDYDWMLYSNGIVSSTADGEMRPAFTTTIGSDTNEFGITGKMVLFKPWSTTQYKNMSCDLCFTTSTGILNTSTGFCRRKSLSAVNAVQLSFSSGDIKFGTVIVRGYK